MLNINTCDHSHEGGKGEEGGRERRKQGGGRSLTVCFTASWKQGTSSIEHEYYRTHCHFPVYCNNGNQGQSPTHPLTGKTLQKRINGDLDHNSTPVLTHHFLESYRKVLKPYIKLAPTIDKILGR